MKKKLSKLNSEVKTLEALLDSELVFTNHLGQVLGKQDDRDAHQSGIIKIEQITTSEQKIQIIGNNVAIVTVRVHLISTYAEISSDNNFRFTRIWSLSSSGTWHIVAAHSSLVIE